MMLLSYLCIIAFIILFFRPATNAIIHCCFLSRNINVDSGSSLKTKRIDKFKDIVPILMSNSAGADSDASDPSNRKIMSLLNRAVKYTSDHFSYSQHPYNNGTGTKMPQHPKKPLLPLRISFSARHCERLSFNDHFFAQRYLSLPPKEYSLLNSSMFSHLSSVEDHETAELTSQSSNFTVSLPLGDLSSALQTAFSFGGLSSTSSSHSSFFKDVTLVSTIQVNSEPDIGVITMSSGPLLLVNDISSDVFSYEEDAQYCEDIPSSLVKTNSSSLDLSLDGSSPQNMSLDKHAGDSAKISAIQTGYKIHLKWNPASAEPSAFVLRSNNNSSSNNGSNTIRRLSRIFNSQLDDNRTEDLLRVDATVRAWVQLDIPVRRDIATALNLLPVRLLLSQAGRMIMLSVMKAIAPRLASSLVEDFERWKSDNLE